ncbi:hypothetical protein ANME2D_00848 [Candidatus Methanoperedens nitroreducens]|uniref:Uncharacterized protein n=1 Tax=Candidatus Methanoperedens nitratireducens TaxID=1392998 RepID=A0A062UZW7_9EURY|nr:hypothetical protein [Candidatus Methanoperedens nitroreducens]KCZ72421.1 hypothetical protein ANME2D_00848 [Candidatus Methanoperedens nitroreducens]MDJ1423644.1 hypothetical protein [Candidatus Methanoperedens sp.]
MKKDFNTRFENSRTLADIFEVVKASVWESMEKKSRGGLMLGLANLGNHPQGFLGAFYPVGSNIIVLNKVPLRRIKETDPRLYKPYIFHVLLHEYLHSLGYLDESAVRQKVYEITRNTFGEDHLATRMAADTTTFYKNLVYPDAVWKADDMGLELVDGFDRSSASYIA